MTRPKAIAIDGNCLMYRCYYATFKQLEYYKAKNLPPLNAYNLFVLSVIKLLNTNHYEYGIIAFDHGKKTFRTEKYEHYKEGRKPMPSELVSQIEIIQNSCKPLGIYSEKKENYEADDLIGSFSHLMNDNGIDVDVFTTDRDYLQLVNPNTIVHMLKKGVSEYLDFDINNFGSLFMGLTPSQVTDFKGLAGDPSDHIMGIAGVGPKTAANILITYGDLDGIYLHLEELTNTNLKEKLKNHREQAIACKELATILCNLYETSDINKFKLGPIDYDDLIKSCEKNNLNQLKGFLIKHKK